MTASAGHPPAEAAGAPGPVFVDVDDEHGALVLSSTPDRAGCEVEIEPVGGAGHRTHVYVLPRLTSRGVEHAAVFGSLPAGSYRVLGADGSVQSELAVAPNRVTAGRWD